MSFYINSSSFQVSMKFDKYNENSPKGNTTLIERNGRYNHIYD